MGETSHQRQVRPAGARHVVHGHALRLRAKLAAERERHDGGLVSAAGELLRQIDDEPLLPADAEPLYHVDDAHRGPDSHVA